MKLTTYWDAAFAGINSRGSQTGYFIFFVGDNDNSVPIS